MPIPDYQTLMLPVLRLTEDGNEHPVTEIRKHMADAFQLTPEELSQKLKSGSTLFANRVAWAVAYVMPPVSNDPSRSIDLSQIDFEALKAHFDKGRKNIEVQKLRASMRRSWR